MVLALLTGVVPAAAQDPASHLYIRLGPDASSCKWSTGASAPNTNVIGSVCDAYWQTGTGGGLWRKDTGTATNTGWILISITFTGAQYRIPYFTATDTIGTSANLTYDGNSVSVLGINGSAVMQGAFGDYLNTYAASDAFGPAFTCFKKRGTIASPAITQNGDSLCQFRAYGAMSASTNAVAASISLEVDGTPGASDMPGRIEFCTTLDGTTTCTERLRITNAGHLWPGTTNTTDVGSDAKKIRALYASELWVQTLVAEYVLATIGGRVLVAPTTYLTADLAAAGTTITLNDNSFSNGHFIVMQKAPGGVQQTEWLKITSGAGGSAGAWTYTVARNEDGSGANDWLIGDAVVTTGTTGSGYIDLYALSNLASGSILGPSITGVVRTGTASYSDIALRWAIGNLTGFSDYTATSCTGSLPCYGALFGNMVATNLAVDPTNGVRFRNGSAVLAQFLSSLLTMGDTATEHVAISTTAVQIKDGATVYADIQGGVVTFGRVAAGQGNVYMSGGAVQLRNNTAVRVHLANDGSGYLANSNFFWDTSGNVTMNAATIGGCTIASTSITCGSGFSVSNTGVVAAISGAIGGCTLATASITCGSGDDVVKIMATDATYRLCIGNASCASAPTTIDKDGNLRSTSGRFGGGSGVDIDSNGLVVDGGRIEAGGGDVVIDDDGITLAPGSSTQNSIKWTGGGYINEASASFMTVNSAGVLFLLGNSGTYLGGNTTTTAAAYPLVSTTTNGSTPLAFKTDGLNGTSSCPGGQFVDGLTAELGIVPSSSPLSCSTPVPSAEVLRLQSEVADLAAELGELRRLVVALVGRKTISIFQ